MDVLKTGNVRILPLLQFVAALILLWRQGVWRKQAGNCLRPKMTSGSGCVYRQGRIKMQTIPLLGRCVYETAGNLERAAYIGSRAAPGSRFYRNTDATTVSAERHAAR